MNLDLDFSNMIGEDYSNVLSRTTTLSDYPLLSKTNTLTPTTTKIDTWKPTTTTSTTSTWKPLGGATTTSTSTTTTKSSTPLLDKLKALQEAKKTSSPSTPSGGGGGGGGMPEPSAGDETEQVEQPQINQARMMPSFNDPKVLGAIGGGVLAYMLVPEKFKMLGIAIAMIGGYVIMGKVKPQDIKEVKEKVQEKVKEKIKEAKK